jgi:hypothetical protein
MMQCLRQHESELSAGCKSSLANRTPGAHRMSKSVWSMACGADLDKFCQNVPPGKGRILECLTSHAGQVSPSCKTALDTHAKQRAAAMATLTAATPGARKKRR